MLVDVFHVLLFVLAHELTIVNSGEYPAPLRFTEEPSYIQFSSKNSGYLHCSAEARSSSANTEKIIITWRYGNGTSVKNISNILVLPNGTLWFPPFKKLIPRVHQGKFQCVAELNVQKLMILSRMAVVDGIILKPFKVIVEDQYLIGTGGTAMFTCAYPKEVSSYVKLKRWWIDKKVTHPEPSGHLVIHDVLHSHSTSLYYCVVLNILTNEILASNVAKLFIQQVSDVSHIPFQFSIPPLNRTTLVGKTVLLECLVARKNMEYTWKHNDKDIKLHHHFSLVGGRSLRITNPSLSDMGKYTCIARDKTSNEIKSASAYLLVQAPLTFLARPVKICAPFSANVTLQCEIDGYPLPTITWYKDAQEITYGKKTMRKGNNLVIIKTYGKDEGIYQCFANNGMETIHQATSLIVGERPPMIIMSFKKKILNQYDKLDVWCKPNVHKYRELTLSWYRDGKFLDEASDSRIDLKQYQNSWTLQIRNITAADSGVYRCEAKTRAGINFSEAEIQVKGPAKITYISRSVRGLSGKDVNITCKAKGYPYPTIKWFDMNNKSLPYNYRQSIKPDGVLTIKGVKLSDKGIYVCKAMSEMGPADYSYASLNVFRAQEDIVRELNVKEEGNDQNLFCMDGTEWIKDGKSIKNDRIQILKFGSIKHLHITNITAQDAGTYTCIKKTDAGIYKESTEIVVITRPRFTNQYKQNYNVLEHGKVHVACYVSGFPTPRVEWQRKMRESFMPIPKSPRFRTTLNGSLTILNVTVEDKTDYSCIVYNTITNKESRTIKLNVNVPARILNWFATVSGDAGNTTKLECNATGNEMLKFTWLKNDLKINVNGRVNIKQTFTSSYLIIRGITIKDAGQYICEVKNKFGEDSRKLTLKVRDKPSPPVITKPYVASKTSIRIAWSITFDGNSPITSHQIAFKKRSKFWSQASIVQVQANETSYRITGLRPYTSYIIQVRAKNILGLSNASIDINAETEEDAPSAAPLLIKIIPIDRSFQIKWKCLSRESSNGVIQGYVIKYREFGSKSEFTKMERKVIHGTEAIINHLKYYTLYEIMLQAFTKAGYGPDSKVTINRTDEGVPSNPPTNINHKVISSTSIFVSWRPPPKYSINGKLVGYRIAYEVTGKVRKNRKLKKISVWDISRNQTSITLRKLGKYTQYSIKLAARTRKGLGKISGALRVVTFEDIPGPPKNLTARTTSVKSIKLDWKKPDYPNGIIIAYQIYVRREEEAYNIYETEDGKRTSYEFDTMTENQTYYFWICAKTKVGRGNCTDIVVASTSEGPPFFTNGPETTETAKWKTNITLDCEFSGFPTLTVTWLNAQEKPLNVKNSNKYRLTDKNGLQIRNLQREDSKRYICKVVNKWGTAKQVVTLKVQAPPYPPKNINYRGMNSTAVEIIWTSGFDSNSVILSYSLQYRHSNQDWKNVNLKSNPTYFRMNIRSGQIYFFKMSARNEIGDGRFSEIGKVKFYPNEEGILQPTEVNDETEDEFQTKSSSKILFKDTAVLGTLIGVCLFIVIVIVVLVFLTKLGYNPGTKLVQRSMETWRWFAAKRMSSEDRRKKRNRRSGGSSTDGHLGGSSSSLSQPASNNGSLFSLPRSSSRITESGYITNFFPTIPAPFSNYTPGPNGCSRNSGTSDEGIGPETRGEQHYERSSIPPRLSNGTPAPLTMIMSPKQYNDPECQENEATSSSKRVVGNNVKRNFPQNIGRTLTSKMENEKAEESDDVSPDLPIGKERVYVQTLGHCVEYLPGAYTQHTIPVNMSPRRPKYEDGHFIIGPDIDRILAYRPPRCYDSTSSEYSSSRDELAQAYEFGKLHHLDDFYGRPTLESASSSGETASSEKDGICHFTTELSVGRPFLIPVALIPPPPNQRQRTRDRKRNIQGAPLNTYYEKDETLV